MADNANEADGSANSATDQQGQGQGTGDQNNQQGQQGDQGQQGQDQGTGDQGDQGAKTDQGDPGEASAEVPENYADFTLPEGMEIDQEALGKATPLFKELGLTQDKAQKVIDLYTDIQREQVQGQIENHNTRVTEWAQQAEADPEIGGEKFKENVAIAKQGLEKFGTPALTELLESYGIGSHPEVVRAFYKIGKLTQEDNPGSGARASEARGNVVDRLYGKKE